MPGFIDSHTTMDTISFEDSFQHADNLTLWTNSIEQDENVNPVASSHASATTGEGQIHAQYDFNLPIHSVSDPSCQRFPSASSSIFQTAHCLNNDICWATDNTLTSSRWSELSTTTTNNSSPTKSGIAPNYSLDFDQVLSPSEESMSFDTSDTAFESWDLIATTILVPDQSFDDGNETSTDSYIDYLEGASCDAFAQWYTTASLKHASDINGQSLTGKKIECHQQYATWTTSPQSHSHPRTAAFSPRKVTNTPDVDQWQPEDLHHIGFQDSFGDWRCKHPSCISNKVFLRACDLRKHYRSHIKTFFCDKADCVWAVTGFSNSKDWRRHKQSHDPQVVCPEVGCGRRFGRADNMREHHRKIHQSARNNLFPRRCRKPSQRIRSRSHQQMPGTFLPCKLESQNDTP